MSFIKPKLIFVLIIFCLTALLAGCKKQEVVLTPQTITFWGFEEDEAALTEIVQDYQKTHPQIQVVYNKFNKDQYQNKLLNALAENKGPDIFVVPNTYLKNYKNKITFLPDEINVPYLDDKGNIVAENKKTVSIKKTVNDFIDVVNNAIIMPSDAGVDASGNALPIKDRIWGFPLSVDTLALYYNKDILQKTGLVDPPKTWQEFSEAVKKITKLDDNNHIVMSGAALGATKNVNYFLDLFSVLVLQSGGKMIDDSSSSILFNQVPPGTSFSYPPAMEVFQFYIDFSSPNKDTYTWNDTLPNSLEAFVQGKTAFYFGYKTDFNLIKLKNPKLSFEVSNLPQIEGNQPVNFAQFNILSVSAKSQNQAAAWDFLQHLTRIENLSKYLEQAQQPTPLRALISTQKNQSSLKIFADQLLTAQIWYKGYDIEKVKSIFSNMITDYKAGKYEHMQEALSAAAYEVQATLSPQQ